MSGGRASAVLCIAPSWLGDAVLARPALALLGSTGADVHVLCRGGLSRVLADLPGVGGVHAVAPGRGPRLRGALQLRGRQFASALVLPPSFSAALGACLAGARLRVGFAGDGRRSLLTHAVPQPGRSTHLAAQYVALVQVLLASSGAAEARQAAVPGSLPAMPLLAVRPQETQAAAAILDRAGWAGRPYVVLAPGARYGPAKRWPAERFAAAAGALAERTGAVILLVGEREDAPATRAVRAAFPAALDLAGQTPLGALVGLLAGARGVLANDSGTMHLAAVLGRPVVGLFGSTNPAWTRPLGPRARVLSHAVPCAPCYRADCNRDFGCMLGIEAAAAVATLVTVLEAPAAGRDAGGPS